MALVNRSIRFLYRTRSGRALCSLAVTLLLLAVALLFSTVTYYENDDSNIAFALAGYCSGEPYPGHPFINCLLAAFVSGLYRLLPALPWWTLVQLGTVLAALYIAQNRLLALCSKRDIPFLIALIGMGLIAFGLFFYPLLLVTFTLTSACIGAAGVALLLSLDAEEDGKKGIVSRLGLSLVCLFLCFLFRNSTGISMLCFYFGCGAILLFRALLKKANRAELLRPLIFMGAVAALALLMTTVNRLGLQRLNEPGFVEFDQARGRYMDYPVDSYSDNPALYEAVGWDRELYAMARQWYFMDERITAERMNHIIAGSQTAQGTLSSALDDWEDFVSVRPLVLFLLLPLLTALLLGAAALAQAPKKGSEFLFLLCMLLGSALLCLYLLLSGRMVVRALQAVLLPGTLAALFLSYNMLSPLPEKGAKRLAGLCLTLLLLLPACYGAYKQARTLLSYNASTPALLEGSQKLMDYAISNADTIFIRDTHVCNNIDAWTVYPEARPTNLLDWGGTGVLTGARGRQLDLLGIEDYTADIFLRENVRLVTAPGSRDEKNFSAYIASRFPGARLEKTAEILPGVEVYRVVVDSLEVSEP